MTVALHERHVAAPGSSRARGPGLLAAGVGALLAAGCTTDANPTFFIDAVLAPTSTMGQCKVPTGTSMDFLAQGVLDLGVESPVGYVLYPRVVNDLAMTAMPPQIESNRVQVKGLDVKLIPPPNVTLPASSTCLAEFHVPVPVTVAPMMGTATLAAEVVQPCHVRGLRASAGDRLGPTSNAPLTIAMRARGTHGGGEILSAEVRFVVRLCKGCLQTGFAGEYANYNAPRDIPRCDQLADNPYPGNPCNPAQDFGPVLCCATDASGQVVECPGQPRAMPTMP